MHQSKIKILHITTLSEIGGAEKLLLLLLENRDVKTFEYTVASLNGKGPLSKNVRELGVPYFDLEWKQIFKLPLHLNKVIKSRKIDILQVHGIKAAIIVCFLAKRMGVKYNIATIHGVDDFKSRIKNFVARIASLNVDLWISVTNLGKTRIVHDFFVSPQKVITIANSIKITPEKCAPGRNKVRKNLNIKEDDFLILTVANLRPIKGHKYCIKAIQLLKQKGYNNFKFVFIGKDKMNGYLSVLAKELQVDDKIVFPGFQEDVTPFLEAADIFLLPSESEGLPLSIMEAMNNGLPVIATNVGGVDELVEDQKTGLLIPPKSPSAIADSIIYLVEKKELCKFFGINAKKKIREEFTSNKMILHYQDSYKALMRNGAKF